MVNWAEDLKVNLLAEHSSLSSFSSHNLISWGHCFLCKVLKMVAGPRYHSRTRRRSSWCLPYWCCFHITLSLFPKTPSTLKLTWSHYTSPTIVSLIQQSLWPSASCLRFWVPLWHRNPGWFQCTLWHPNNGMTTSSSPLMVLFSPYFSSSVFFQTYHEYNCILCELIGDGVI